MLPPARISRLREPRGCGLVLRDVGGVQRMVGPRPVARALASGGSEGPLQSGGVIRLGYERISCGEQGSRLKGALKLPDVAARIARLIRSDLSPSCMTRSARRASAAASVAPETATSAS